MGINDESLEVEEQWEKSRSLVRARIDKKWRGVPCRSVCDITGTDG